MAAPIRALHRDAVAGVEAERPLMAATLPGGRATESDASGLEAPCTSGSGEAGRSWGPYASCLEAPTTSGSGEAGRSWGPSWAAISATASEARSEGADPAGPVITTAPAAGWESTGGPSSREHGERQAAPGGDDGERGEDGGKTVIPTLDGCLTRDRRALFPPPGTGLAPSVLPATGGRGQAADRGRRRTIWRPKARSSASAKSDQRAEATGDEGRSGLEEEPGGGDTAGGGAVARAAVAGGREAGPAGGPGGSPAEEPTNGSISKSPLPCR